MRYYLRLIFNTLKQLSFSKIIKLLKLTLPHPIFSVLSAYATIKSFIIAKQHYPKSHSTDGPGNAFRHALWCCLILMYCCKVSSARKSLKWCRRMTDMHEEIFPNPPLQRRMDLHNNKVGIRFFKELLPGIHRQFFETQFFIGALKEKTASAEILHSADQKLGAELVYLENTQ